MKLLALAAFFVAIFTQISAHETLPKTTPSSATKDGTISKLDSQKETRKSKNPDTTSTPISPCVQCVSPCTIKEPHAQSEEEKANAASLDRLYRRYMLATIVGVGGGFLGVGLLIWQSILLRKSTKTSMSAAQTAEDTLRMAYRPWVNADSAELVGALRHPPHARFTLQVNLYLKNTGTSVAVDGLMMSWAIPDFTPAMSANIDKAWKEIENMRRVKQEGTPWETGFVLNPGGILECPVTMGSDDISYEQVARGDFYILGCIFYGDQFGTIHRTQFCFRPTQGVGGNTLRLSCSWVFRSSHSHI